MKWFRKYLDNDEPETTVSRRRFIFLGAAAGIVAAVPWPFEPEPLVIRAHPHEWVTVERLFTDIPSMYESDPILTEKFIRMPYEVSPRALRFSLKLRDGSGRLIALAPPEGRVGRPY